MTKYGVRLGKLHILKKEDKTTMQAIRLEELTLEEMIGAKGLGMICGEDRTQDRAGQDGVR
jgi:hypothetical protein